MSPARDWADQRLTRARERREVDADRPESAAGVLVSGGSAANLTALACAREARIGPMDEQAIVYMSDQTHSSLARAARALGFRPDQVRIIPTDEEARMRPDALRSAIVADRAGGTPRWSWWRTRGRPRPAPSTRSAPSREICREHGVWLHVDGAYGAFACLSERGREALAGMELADSITLDPHKWLYQPVELGSLLVRDGGLLRRGFEISPDYLSDVDPAQQEVNFSDRGLQLTRTCRAIKLWISIRYFGVAAFRAAIDACLDLTHHAEQHITAASELELMTPASLGVITFRRHPRGVDDEAVLERINAALAEEIQRQGDVFVSTARVAAGWSCGCASSTTRRPRPRSTARSIWRRRCLSTSLAGPAAISPSYPPIAQGWLRRRRRSSARSSARWRCSARSTTSRPGGSAHGA